MITELLIEARACECACVLTAVEVAIAVGFAASLLVVGHGRHLLGRGAAHGLTL